MSAWKWVAAVLSILVLGLGGLHVWRAPREGQGCGGRWRWPCEFGTTCLDEGFVTTCRRPCRTDGDCRTGEDCKRDAIGMAKTEWTEPYCHR